jgi:hypothetical protein
VTAAGPCFCEYLAQPLHASDLNVLSPRGSSIAWISAIRFGEMRMIEGHRSALSQFLLDEPRPQFTGYCLHTSLSCHEADWADTSIFFLTSSDKVLAPAERNTVPRYVALSITTDTSEHSIYKENKFAIHAFFPNRASLNAKKK